MSGHKKKRPPPQLLQSIDVEQKRIAAILERTRTVLNAEEHATLSSLVDTVAWVQAELQTKDASLERLRRMIFGASTESTRNVLGEEPSDKHEHGSASSPAPTDPAAPRPKPPGHGRNAAAAYTGAERVSVTHPHLHGGEACPGCASGKLYPQSEPAKLVRITGMAPMSATVYSCDRLRCNLCGEVFTAPAPEGVGTEKYDATATSMVGLLKYGAGLPFNRIEKLQDGMGIPLPAATQWDLVQAAAKTLTPAHEELLNQAAQATVLYNDDTTMKVLQLTRKQRAAALADDIKGERTGIFTSGIVATEAGQQIALFFTGVRHAGENLAAVLARRNTDLPAPIQMCDGLSRNIPSEFDTVISQCMAHARRRYVELTDTFPAEVRFVLETLREVYITDARAREQNLDPAQRLALHQAESAAPMKALDEWMQRQFTERIVEPNSALGAAIIYMQKRWPELTLFLRVAGAPLDNNTCERALKKAILHRKNALFYRTLAGAHVGDVFMSLIHTAELNHIAPFEYLVALQRHTTAVAANPAHWMPWNYQTTLAQNNAGPDPPA
ncbi:MAG TPA: IS66 family transposase [Casimicrobiaceae bacterium]|nr:IS66 family transposase [Casimicrobiaceae bacterium]